MQAVNSLWTHGYARLGTLLSRSDCEATRELYQQPDIFRSRIDMARFRFGRGEYQYFRYPLPAHIDQLRHELYSHLAPAATEWMTALKISRNIPRSWMIFLDNATRLDRSGQRL